MTHITFSSRAARTTLLALFLSVSIAHGSVPSARALDACPKLLGDTASDDHLLGQILGRFTNPGAWKLHLHWAASIDHEFSKARLRASTARHPEFAIEITVEYRTRTGEVDRLIFEPDQTAPPTVTLSNAFPRSPLHDSLSGKALARARSFWNLRVDDPEYDVRHVRTYMRSGHSMIYVEFEVDGLLEAGTRFERAVTRPVVFVVHPMGRADSLF